MSKARRGLLVLLVSVFLVATTASAAAAATSEIQFLGAHFIVGKGLALTFKVSTDFDLTDFNLLEKNGTARRVYARPHITIASVNVNGVLYGMECIVKEENSTFRQVVCLVEVSTSSVGGEASIAFGPYAFSATIKDPRDWCYGIFDYGPSTPWGQIGTHCQVRVATTGDSLQFLSLFRNFDMYIFGDPYCEPPVPDFGGGYYYIGC